MSTHARRILAVLTCMVLMIGLITGCGTKPQVNQSTTVQATSSGTTVEATPEAKGITFPYTGEAVEFTGYAADIGLKEVDTPITQEYAKRLGNVKVKWEFTPFSDYDQKLKLFLNSGDMPDIIWARDAIGTSNTYGSTGIFLDFNQYKDYMPNLTNLSSQLTYLNYTVNDKGQRFALHGYSKTDWPMEGWFYNKTVLDKYGIKVPETQEEFVDAMKKIKAADSKIIPYLSYFGTDYFVYAMSQMYGINCNSGAQTDLTFNSETGKWEYGPAQQNSNYKKALEFCNMLWKEKLINPEVNTMSAEQEQAKLEQGQWAFSFMYFGGPEQDVFKGKPMTYEVKPMSTPTFNGKAYLGITNIHDGVPYWGTFCSAKTKNPELLAALMDLHLAQDITDLKNWGIEGLTYKKNDDGTKSFLSDIAYPTNPSGTKKTDELGLGKIIDLVYFSEGDHAAERMLQYGPAAMEAYNFTVDKLKSGRLTATYGYPAPTLSQEEADKISSIMNPIKTYVKENAYKFISGQTSFDKWDDYVSQIKKLGDIDYVLNLYNSKPQYKLGERVY